MKEAMTMSGMVQPIPFSLKIKDPGSAITHFIGAIASLVSGPFLISHYMDLGADRITIIAGAVFVLSMLLLYSASTAYHSVIVSPEADKKFRKVDHMMIFVLIAGSYTPVCVITLKDGCGYKLLAAVWAVAALGMIFKLFWVTCPKWVSSVIYICMGWLCAFAIPEIWAKMPFRGFMWLLSGGIIYTVGGVLYALKLEIFNSKHKYFGSHEIFHICVMLGNLCQFVTIYKYLL